MPLAGARDAIQGPRDAGRLHRQIKPSTGACSLYAEQIRSRCQRHEIVRDVAAVIGEDMLWQLLGKGQAFPLVP